MDYEKFYSFVMEEEKHLKESGDVVEDYQQCKALAACYELQEYLARRIAQKRENDPSYDPWSESL